MYAVKLILQRSHKLLKQNKGLTRERMGREWNPESRGRELPVTGGGRCLQHKRSKEEDDEYNQEGDKSDSFHLNESWRSLTKWGWKVILKSRELSSPETEKDYSKQHRVSFETALMNLSSQSVYWAWFFSGNIHWSKYKHRKRNGNLPSEKALVRQVTSL